MVDSSKPTEVAHCRVVCFEDKAAVEKIDEAFTELLGTRHAEAVKALLPVENVYRYSHGGNWERPAHANSPETKMKTLSASWELPWQALVDNDLGLIDRGIGPITKSMDRQFAEMMYETVGEAAEKVGNVVNAKEMPNLAEAYLAMIEKIEIGVDRSGNLSLPEMHADPATAAKFLAALESQAPEFKERLERILAKKRDKALAAEAARKSKFKSRAN